MRKITSYSGVCILMLMSFVYCHETSAHPSGYTLYQPYKPSQYVTVNVFGPNDDEFRTISELFGTHKGEISIGVGFILTYFNSAPGVIQDQLIKYLALSEKYSVPIVVQISGEIFWGYRSDLWNWWDPDKPGFNPENRYNVEWTDWTPDSAVKMGTINWGTPVTVPPKVNFMSPAFRKACHQEMSALIPIIQKWWYNLPEDKKYLFIGLKMGWESSIFDARQGYAAVSTAGIANSGPMKEEYKTEVVRRHLEDYCRYAWKLGLPRDHIFTHSGGWTPGESLYTAAVNRYSCPGWSFYSTAPDVSKDITVMNALKTSDAPYWGAVEYLLLGNNTMQQWFDALNNAFQVERLRYLCIFNWQQIKDNQNAIGAIQKLINEN